MKPDSHITNRPAAREFRKMHGLGNDFVIIDARHTGDDWLTPALVRGIGDRNRGIGFDQLAVIHNINGEFRIDFWNSDGSRADACGNATRCVAHLLMQETGQGALELATGRGKLQVERVSPSLIAVNMGHPQMDWADIPLSRPVDTTNLPLPGAPAAVGMGNPHCVFIVDDVAQVDLAREGARFEHDPLFPERTNVEFVEVIDCQNLRMRVWERGGMITLACGSGACAAAVVAVRRGLTDRHVTIALDGGILELDWRDDGVWMTGPFSEVFAGTLSPTFLESLS